MYLFFFLSSHGRKMEFIGHDLIIVTKAPKISWDVSLEQHLWCSTALISYPDPTV